ncbi:MAG: hypothetical protein IT380_13440 [Myxococcales bacterium]|nr:hypothetical protein [Myxococcales bacterium]
MRALGLVGLCFVVVGCKKPSAEVPGPDAVGAAKASGPAKPVVAFPVAPSTLSVFAPVEKACEWRAVEPVAGVTRVIASLPGSCVGARVSFGPDASKAVVWFDPWHVQRPGYFAQTASAPGYPEEKADEQARPRAFIVSTKDGKVEPLPLPALAGQKLTDVGVTADGAVLAFLEEGLSDEVRERGTVTLGAETFDLTQFTEGLPELAHAYRFQAGKWTRAETKATTTGWDYALGVQALDVFRKVGARSVELSSAHAQGDVLEGGALAALKPLAPKKAASPDDGHWIFLGVGSARVYAWEVTGELAYTTGLVAAGSPPKVLAKLGFTDGDLVSLRSSASFLLVTSADVGTHPRLYELPSAKLLFASDSARGVTFWPTAIVSTGHEASRPPP